MPTLRTTMPVTFERIGSSDDGGQVMTAIVPWLKTLVGRYGKCSADVSGHADTLGSDTFNRALSEQRARVVFEKLNSRVSWDSP